MCGSGVVRVYTFIFDQEDFCIFNFCLPDLISETFTYPERAESPVSVPCASSEGKEETGLGLVTRKQTDWGNPGVRDRAGGGGNASRKLDHELCRRHSLQKGSEVEDTLV